MFTLANFSLTTPSTKPRKPRIRRAWNIAKEAGGSALGGAGTGSLAALIVKPESGKAQRKGAYIGAGIAAANSLRKSLIQKPKIQKRSY